MNTAAMLVEAQRILSLNDKGHYTVPTHGLYPFQWNWDSCLTALGLQQFNEDRAWQEIETLVKHQWPDGMVPHIVFHEKSDAYFPGPEVWSTHRPTPTSGITQPPVMGLVLEQLWLRGARTEGLRRRCHALMQAADRWHQWFYRCRDPHDTGLVALLHPWESGRDNSLDWVDALCEVNADHVGTYQRRDIQHVDPSQRPTAFEYDRYIALVQTFRAMNWDNERLHDASPFQVVDPGFNAILIHADQAMARLAETLGDSVLAERARCRAQQGLLALETLWSDHHGQYLCWDRRAQKLVDSASVGGLLPVLVLPAGHKHLLHLCERLSQSLILAPFGVASHWPEDERFDPVRYWRGPSWLIINYLLIKGLQSSQQEDLAHAIVQASLRCIEQSGCSEYYDPINGNALGGGTFTWTAAMVMEFLKHHQS
jgi:glycogen debranching enzyme